jgi:hypothetical protein
MDNFDLRKYLAEGKLVKEGRYIMFSDAYKALSKIYYNGEFYDIVEIVSDNEISDQTKMKLIKHALEIEVMSDDELRKLR